jgi:hypothetical protein
MRNILDTMLDIRSLVSFVVLLLILLLLESQFSWASTTFGQLLTCPEIRFHRYSSRTAQIGRESFSEDIFAVENRGGEPAREVYLSVIVPFGRITRYDFICQEPYVITETVLHDGRLGIWLERLTPGAKAVLYVWSTTEAEPPSPVEFSITAQQGTVKPVTELTAAEEIESYIGFIEWTGRKLFHFLQSTGLVERISEIERRAP